jgi:hypothetical protein
MHLLMHLRWWSDPNVVSLAALHPSWMPDASRLAHTHRREYSLKIGIPQLYRSNLWVYNPVYALMFHLFARCARSTRSSLRSTPSSASLPPSAPIQLCKGQTHGSRLAQARIRPWSGITYATPLDRWWSQAPVRSIRSKDVIRFSMSELLNHEHLEWIPWHLRFGFFLPKYCRRPQRMVHKKARESFPITT